MVVVSGKKKLHFPCTLCCGLRPFLLLFSAFSITNGSQTKKTLRFYPHRKVDGTCGFTTFTRSSLAMKMLSVTPFTNKTMLCLSTQISGCDLQWNWIHHWHSGERKSNFSQGSFSKVESSSIFRVRGELMIADAGGGGGGYTWGPLPSPVLSQKARLLRLHTRLWMPLAAIIKQSTSVVKWLCE